MKLFHSQLNEKLERYVAKKMHADDSVLDEIHNFRALHVGGDNGSDPTWQHC